MAQWGANNVANNSVKVAAEEIDAGSGRTAQAANNTALFNNTTPLAFKNLNAGESIIGQFGVEVAAMANTTGEGGKVTHAGWVLRRAGLGGILRLSIANGGTGYTNLANFNITAGAGATNTVGQVLTTDANGTILTVSGSGGLFPNVSYITVGSPANAVVSFGITNGALGYTTGDVATVSNGTINASATIVANSSANGKITAFTLVTAGSGWAANVDAVITIKAANGSATGNGVLSASASGNRGNGYASDDTILFSNGTVNATATITVGASGNISTIVITNVGSGFASNVATAVTVLAANGAASNGSAAVIVPTLLGFVGNVAISGGASANLVPVLGGRAGRVNYETLVAMSSIVANTGSNTSVLPE